MAFSSDNGVTSEATSRAAAMVEYSPTLGRRPIRVVVWAGVIVRCGEQVGFAATCRAAGAVGAAAQHVLVV